MSKESPTDWQARSKAWAANAVKGRSVDDDFNQMIIVEAGIRPGEVILDLAAGTGNPSVSMALSMEGRGMVVCTDLTFGMLEVARSRAATLDLSILHLAGCDMTGLPFRDAAFDCITCRFGIMTVGDKQAALAEAMRVLRPGGRVAYAVWGAYEENPPFWVPRRAVADFLHEEEGPPPSRHSMSAPGTLENLLSTAGFERSVERELRYDRPVPDLDDYVSSGLKRSFGPKIEGLTPDQLTSLHDAVCAAWKTFEQDGMVQVPNYARIGIGWRPAETA